MPTVKPKRSRLQSLLDEHVVCSPARRWCKACKTPLAAWRACKNPKWMLWALRELGQIDDGSARLFGCWCCRKMWHLLTDERSRKAVEVAERFAKGRASRKELDAAGIAAWNVANGSNWVNKGFVAVACATNTAGGGGYYAADSCSDAAAANGVSSVAQCDQIRKMWPNPFKRKHTATKE